MALTAGQFKFFADFIQKNIGIIYLPENYFQLEKRLEEIAHLFHLKSLEDLYVLSTGGLEGQLKQALLDVATNNETSFFRDPPAFRLIEEKALPRLAARRKRLGKIRIWSCASSFGQEPYSLAMLAHEFTEKDRLSSFDIYATDICDKALSRAKTAVYSNLEVHRGLSAVRLAKYFTHTSDDMWQIKPEIKNRVSFAKQNLLDPFSNPGPFDLIFCRYVLIYQSEEKKKEIIEKLARTLSPQGYLVLGGSESLIGLSKDFDQVSQNGAVIYKKKP